MSIIDQICDIEETLIKMRKDSEQKILEINNDFSVKKAKMREHFVQELAQKNTELQQDMYVRVEEYNTYLLKYNENIREVLAFEFENKKENILQIVCKMFWKE